MIDREALINEVTWQVIEEDRTRWLHLIETLQSMQRVVVAFSGGIDSAFLAVAAWLALDENMLAVTIHSPVHIDEDDNAALSVAEHFGFPHAMVEYDDLHSPVFVSNPIDRCYYCKRERFTALKEYAIEHGYPFLLEGSNGDDIYSDRPGAKAVKELKVRSPLQELGYTKTDIRRVSHILGIPVWDRPPSPCLATRIPFGTEITHADLQTVAKAEEILKERRFTSVRVRYQPPVARIEVDPGQIETLAQQRESIVSAFQALGVKRVLVDLQGYQSGSLTEDVKK
jgi:pyridinium-3,5-biscarboxylic acid mononucleotide sulfurtransferase